MVINSDDWRMLSFVELAHFVQLFTQRALHTKSNTIRVDLENAQQYLVAMQVKLDDIKENI